MNHAALFVLLLAINFTSLAQPTNYQDSLNLTLNQVSNQGDIPGFGAIIIRDGEVKYAAGFGYENVASQKPYTTGSIQNIASLSKTAIGVALMKCVALDLLQLDDPINQYLPYKIVNPHFPQANITVRHLATHTSTLNDPEDYERAYIFQNKIETGEEKIPKTYKKYIKQYNANKRVSLDEFVQSIFIAGGKYYRTKNFLKAMPGEKFEYSNIGAGIASRIVEIVSKMSFQDFTAKYIFEPLGMQDTGWDLTDEVLDKKVIPYLTATLPFPQYDLVTFADGGLITSLDDFSKYMIEMIRCYNGEGQILSKALCREMMTPHLSEGQFYGIFWEISASKLSIGHNGADPGAITNCYFQPATGVAKILFGNLLPYDKKTTQAFRTIWSTLRKYEDKVN